MSGINTTNNHTLAVITANRENIDSKVQLLSIFSLHLSGLVLGGVRLSGLLVLVHTRGGSVCVMQGLLTKYTRGLWGTGEYNKEMGNGYVFAFIWIFLCVKSCLI